MLRIIVGVLAAFVGFSFGHSIPKWMETKSKSPTGAQPPSDEPVPHARKHSFRRKSIRKFKFGFHRTGADGGEINVSAEKLCKVGDGDDSDAEATMSSHGGVKCAKSMPLSLRGHLLKERKKLKFGSQRLIKDDSGEEYLHQQENSAMNKLVPREKLQCDRCNPFSENILSANSENVCNQQKASHTAMESSTCRLHSVDMQSTEASMHDSVPSEPVNGNCASLKSAYTSQKEEQSQMKQWKMKLTSLRTKAMASEKVWYQKFENAEESCGGKRLAALPRMGSIKATKKSAQGKENESPHVIINKKRDLFWCRSSSRVGLLVER